MYCICFYVMLQYIFVAVSDILPEGLHSCWLAQRVTSQPFKLSCRSGHSCSCGTKMAGMPSTLLAGLKEYLLYSCLYCLDCSVILSHILFSLQFHCYCVYSLVNILQLNVYISMFAIPPTPALCLPSIHLYLIGTKGRCCGRRSLPAWC